MAPVIPDLGARQGPKGRPVLYVLIASLVLLGIYMVGLMTWSSSQPPDYATRSNDAARETVTGSPTGSTSTPPASSSNAASVPGGNPAYPAPAERK